MDRTKNERREKRLRYQWTVLFTAGSNKTVSEGLMVDVSSGGIAFRCPVGENCPKVGEQVVTHFSIPADKLYDPLSMNSFTREGRAVRVDELNPFLRHIAIEFDEPLPLKPAAQLEHAENQG
jgi:hypothetical protein